MHRSAAVLMVFFFAACTSPSGSTDIVDVADPNTDTAADAPPDLSATTPIPWEPAPPDPALVVPDPPFVQEFNHTWNEAEWGGPLIGLVDPPAVWGWERPTLVTPRGLLLRTDGALAEVTIPEGGADLVDAATGPDGVFLAASDGLYGATADGTTTLLAAAPEGVEVRRLAVDAAGADLLSSEGFGRWTGADLVWVPLEPAPTAMLRIEGGVLLAGPGTLVKMTPGPEDGPETQHLADLDVGTPIAILTDRTLPEALAVVVVGTGGIAGFVEALDGLDPVQVPLFQEGSIPLANARAARPDSNGGFVVAADGGAYRLVNEEIGPEWRVYVPERWMPDGDVRDVMAIDDGGLGELWFATAKGPGWVTRTEWTLHEKTAPMIQRIVARHDRDGAVADSRLSVPGDLSTSIPWDSDNDGGWTCYWVLSECMRWKLTGDPEAKAHFDKSLDRMLSYRTLTGTDWFLARAVIRIDGCILDDCDDPDDGEWFLSPDEEWWVKADTSNDEVTSHMFMMGQAYDLCADDGQKEAIEAHVAGIVGGIMDHGWTLLDPQDMQPTSYGQFEPFYVNDWPAGAWADGARRSAQILGALNLAWYLTGEQRFLDGKAALIEEHHYDENVTHMGDPELYPFCAGSADCDELALQAFVPLIRYETDPGLREKWLTGWRRMWEHLRLQQDLYWELANVVFTGEDADLATGMRWFRRYPTDLIRFPMHNQLRQDLITAPDYYMVKDAEADFFMRSDDLILPPDERPNQRHNSTQYSAFSGWGSNREMDDADVLYTYWLGRYYGFIEAP